MGGPPAPQYSPGYADPKPVYRPFGAVYQQADQPPPAQAGQVNSIGLQQTPGQGQGQDPKKPSRFGRLGETVSSLPDFTTSVSNQNAAFRWPIQLLVV